MVSIEQVKTGQETTDICSVCNKQLVLIETFGKKQCRSCYLARPHRKGHSGMLPLSKEELDKQLQQGRFSNYEIELVRVPKGNKIFSTIYLGHYPQSKGIMGRSLCYIIYYKGRIMGIIAGNSPPKLNVLRERFGDIPGLYNKVINNVAYCLIYTEHNLASRILRLYRIVIKKDYKQKYGEELIGQLTFEEPPYVGTCYKGDNWEYCGMTKGIHVTRRGPMWVYKQFTPGNPKHIYIYRYKR